MAGRLRTVGAAISGRSETQLVPQTRLSGPMPWVIAIMVLLTAIAAAAGLALGNLASQASADLSGGITVQVVNAAPGARARQANDALAVLRETPGVVQVRLVPAAEVDALLEPWLGTRVASGNDEAVADALPVPALIDARLAGPADDTALGRIRARLANAAPDARVDAQAGWLEPVFAAIVALRWLAAALIALLALTTIAAVLLAARTALDSHRGTIEIVHMLGGTDAQIARVFQRSIAIDAAAGGALGLALAVGIVLLLGQRFAALGSGLAGGAGLGWDDWLVLALVPLAGVALATVTARAAVLRALRRML
ncbi:cell division protein [Novosphingobium sp. Gsoil 351]|nr:cell division protein [Novosphingobium sp. Gsoil 351]